MIGFRLNDFILPPDAEPRDPPVFDADFRDAFVAHLKKIAEEAASAGAGSVFLTTPWCREKCPRQALGAVEEGLTVTHNAIRNSLAGDRVIDLDEAMSGKCRLFIDHVHSNPDGDERKAQAIFEALRPGFIDS